MRSLTARKAVAAPVTKVTGTGQRRRQASGSELSAAKRYIAGVSSPSTTGEAIVAR